MPSTCACVCVCVCVCVCACVFSPFSLCHSLSSVYGFAIARCPGLHCWSPGCWNSKLNGKQVRKMLKHTLTGAFLSPQHENGAIFDKMPHLVCNIIHIRHVGEMTERMSLPLSSNLASCTFRTRLCVKTNLKNTLILPARFVSSSHTSDLCLLFVGGKAMSRINLPLLFFSDLRAFQCKNLFSCSSFICQSAVEESVLCMQILDTNWLQHFFLFFSFWKCINSISKDSQHWRWNLPWTKVPRIQRDTCKEKKNLFSGHLYAREEWCKDLSETLKENFGETHWRKVFLCYTPLCNSKQQREMTRKDGKKLSSEVMKSQGKMRVAGDNLLTSRLRKLQAFLLFYMYLSVQLTMQEDEHVVDLMLSFGMKEMKHLARRPAIWI